jgi:hypothetical protein
MRTGRDLGVHFEGEGHTYTLASGEVVPSLSEVIAGSGRYPPFPQSPKMEYLKKRGTLAHQAIAFALRGTLDESSVDPQLEGYLFAARMFIADLELIPLEIEAVLIDHPQHRFAGTVDLLAVREHDSKLFIIDWKTGGFYQEYIARAGGYIHLVDQAIDGGFDGDVIYPSLKQNGQYLASVIDKVEALAQWTMTLRAYLQNKDDSGG